MSEMIEHEEALEQIGYLKVLLNATTCRLAVIYPYFFLWGAIWVAGYLGTYFLQRRSAGILWLVLISFGFIAGGAGRLRRARGTGRSPFGYRLICLNVVLTATAIVVRVVFVHSMTGHQILAYIPFVIGTIYIANGIFIGRPLLLPGLWIVACSLATFGLSIRSAELWMAFAGGGGLLSSGMLLRHLDRSSR